MLIVCPHCQARYDFPAEQMGGETLRVRCSACGHVTTLTPDGSTLDRQVKSRGVDDDAPAQAGYVVVNRRSRAPQPAVAPEPAPRPPPTDGPAPPSQNGDWGASDSLPPDPLEDCGPGAGADDADARAPGIELPPAAPRDPERALRPAQPDPVSVGGRDDRDVEDEPSIIIDIGNLGDGRRTPPPEAPAAPALPPASVTAPPRLDLLNPASAAVDLDIPDVPRRSAGRFFFSLAVFSIAGLLLFVWARNDFGDVLKDPARSFATAFGQGPPTAPPTAPAIVVEPPPPVGKLYAHDAIVEVLPKRGSGVRVQGVLSNTTTVAHGAITLRALLLKDGLPVRERTVPCCDDFDLPTAQTVAQNPQHPHFNRKLNNLEAAVVPPGGTRRFSVVFPDTADLTHHPLVPIVEVKHSEPVRTP
jgi:predicted Zn finger-like uncharacterized protein